MNDPFDIYNNTPSDIICANGTIPASGFISVGSGSAQAWAKDPIVIMNIWLTNVGISVYGTDFGYGFGSQGDVWLAKLAAGLIAY